MEVYNPFSLKGKYILITGVSSGIGRAIASVCSKMGGQLVVTGRDKTRLKETFLSLSGEGHIQIVADLSKAEDIEALIKEVPKLDGVVSNAGIVRPLLAQFAEKKDILDIFEINTFAPFVLIQKLIQEKKLNKKASIIFTSSISGVFCSSVGGSLYSASKGAINGYMKGLALDLANRGIRVNSVNPGVIETNLFSEDTITSDQLEEDVKRYPLKRLGKPEEVAYSVVYLLSDASEWVTGSNLLIDGGYTLL
ncbi:3-oxoacyl-[acyl-carrier-protein] reductase FabG [termite gut metagenome]|uniref:3-oxoacyl-[acyl-carrier-protein] reductase FabG n=1 Tax=termite gut metagenome TaxID=433724 RepID=A0A5J4SQ13_9ZZZZ